MRVVFMGTPDFAVGTLEEIVKAGHEVVGVVTQPESMAQCLHKAAGKNAENLERPGKRGNFRETAGAACESGKGRPSCTDWKRYSGCKGAAA